MDRLTAHRDYTTQVIRLMIWYVWHLSKCGNPRPIPELLETHVDIMRKTSLFDGRHSAPSGSDGPVGLDPPIPQWDALKAELATRIAAHGGPDTARLEDACWSLLEPYISPKLQEAPAAEYPYECWDYNLLEQYPNIINLHFANAYRPDSPFEKCQPALVATLLRLIEEAVAAHPTLTRVLCASWLNQFQPFAALFPPTWSASFKPVVNYLANDDWWCQYMDKRGVFHQARGRQFRHSKAHPYRSGVCQCDVSEVVDHLRG